MPNFTFTGDQAMVYPDQAAADGSTLLVQPGETVELEAAPDANFAPAASRTRKAAPEAPQTPSDAPSAEATATPDPSTPENA